MVGTLRKAALITAVVCAVARTAAAQNDHPVHAEPRAATLVISSAVPFATLMDQAMERMHTDMMAAKPTGDPERDFLTMMIPHHQGAVDMAKIMLLHTSDPRLRNLALSIITDQQYEIQLMQSLLAAGKTGRPAATKKETKE